MAHISYSTVSVKDKVLWTPVYHSILDILGSTGTIIPLGDTTSENAGRTTCTTRGDQQVVFTYSEAVTSFDTAPGNAGPGKIPVILFNDVDEEADTPDIAYWTRGNAAVDSAFSVGCWIKITNLGENQRIISKWGAVAREWMFWVNSGNLTRLDLWDESVDKTPFRPANTALTAATWAFIVATYDGGGGATAANGINLYTNGALDNGAATNDALYVAMEDLTAPVEIAMLSTSVDFDAALAGGPLGIFFVQAELSADAIIRLYQIGREMLGV